MKKLTSVVATVCTLLIANSYAAKPMEYHHSVEQVMEKDSRVKKLARQLLKDGFISQGCESQIIYYINTPATTEYVSAKANCTYYQPHEGIGFSTTYAQLKFDILFNKNNQFFRSANTIDLSYNTVY